MNQALRVSRLSFANCFGIWIGISALLISPATAQVNGSGPSPSSDFDTVVNLPDDQLGFDGDIGGVAGETIQINVLFGGRVRSSFADFGSEVNFNGGAVEDLFSAGSGSEVNVIAGNVFLFRGALEALSGSNVNISGGALRGDVSARSGSVVDISGGRFLSNFEADSGSLVHISGGTFGNDFVAAPGSEVELVGGEYRLNGAEFTGSNITVGEDDVFTGTLADGSPFLFAESARATLDGVTLTVASLPPVDLNPIVVDDLNVSVPSGLRAGQTLTLRDGGLLRENFKVIDATLNVEAGGLRSGTDVYSSVVNISGGTVGSFNVFSGSEVSISGGDIGSNFDVFSGSVVNISGGDVGSSFDAESGSVVNISGGTFGNGFTAESGSDVELIGGEFRLNGADFSDGTISLADGDVFSGTLADGSSFIFSIFSDRLTDVTLTEASLPAPDLSPIVISAPEVSGPSGLRAGQTMTVAAGGSLGNFFAAVDATINVEADGGVGNFLEVSGSEVNISGGDVGAFFHAFDSEVNVTSGTVGDFFEARSGSVVNISGGTVGTRTGNLIDAFPGTVVNISGGTVLGWFDAQAGSEVNISGGTVTSLLDAKLGSVVNISGGTVGDFLLSADGGSEVNISGGTVAGIFNAFSFSEVNLVGSDFVLNGQSLNESLTIDTPFTILDRDVTLSGLLADGSPFSFDLNSSRPTETVDDFFDPNATLTVTLVSAFLLGDCNHDGVVTFSDIPSFIEIMTAGSFLAEADCNLDGEVNVLDIAPFIAILASN